MSVWQDTKRKKALDDLGFDWGDDELYLHFQWPEVLISFYSVMVRLCRYFCNKHLILTRFISKGCWLISRRIWFLFRLGLSLLLLLLLVVVVVVVVAAVMAVVVVVVFGFLFLTSLAFFVIYCPLRSSYFLLLW